MRGDGPRVRVARPIESSVPDELVVGHAHWVGPSRCSGREYADDTFDFSIAKRIHHVGFQCLDGALFPVFLGVQLTAVADFQRLPKVATNAPVAVLPSQSCAEFQFPSGVNVGAGFGNLHADGLQSIAALSLGRGLGVWVRPPRRQESLSFLDQ